MKQLMLFCAVFFVAVFAKAQTAHVNTNSYDNTTTKKALLIIPDTLKVSLNNDKLFLVYKNQEIAAASIQVLDSLLKKSPGKEKLAVEFDSDNGEAEKFNAIDKLLINCPCRVTKRAVKVHPIQ